MNNPSSIIIASQTSQLSLGLLIPTCDRPGRLTACLASIASQDLSMVEGSLQLFILDSGTVSALCSSEIVRIMDALSFRGVRTYYLRRPNPKGIFWIRRELYDASTADIVCYLDDDIILGPGVLRELWNGIVEDKFDLAAGFLVDVDALHESAITLSGHCIRESIAYLVQRIRRGGLKTVRNTWLEMHEPLGACLMFSRATFDSVGGWARMSAYFETQPDGWAEDTALCVALKSVGSAFVTVKEIVFHFPPRNRLFRGFETPLGLKEFMVASYGGWYPDQLPAKHSRASTDGDSLIRTLEAHLDRLA